MFLCKRHIDIHARFGVPRLAFLSIVTTIIAFLISYEIMYYFVKTPLSDKYFLLLLLFIILMYPIHKSIHLFFFLPYMHAFRLYKLNKKKWLPYFNTYVNTPVRKFYFCINLILPFLIITSILIFLTYHFPSYGHYFMFLLSLNLGLSVMDFLYLKIILFSKEGQFVEEHQTGINLLTKVPFHSNF
ncbi:putative zincin peptidase [Staphylococcus hominis]